MSRIIALGVKPVGFGLGVAIGSLFGIAAGVVIGDLIVRIY